MPSSILSNKVLGCLLAAEIGDAMGAPAENKTYLEILAQSGEINDFSGSGTDDSALKHILCDAIQQTQGYPDADSWAEAWLASENQFFHGMFWIPVMNSFWRIRAEGIAPRDAGLGNMASSSSAMCISPMGIINAGNPRQAALETYELAGLIHHNFARDGACSMAAATAAAFCLDASVDSILTAALEHLPSRSAQVMRASIEATLTLARETGEYAGFRERFYAERILPGIAMPDARETVPVALALFFLANGDPRQTILYGANFGRDADTIASMAGALAGALHGVSALPEAWTEKILASGRRDQVNITTMLVDMIHRRVDDQVRVAAAIQALS
ncbi:MAG: ADP-ribosylglycohydrolase family protein [Anaerolineaceae bacterium]|nr:ADP-ribosylglycohydrolase family protein [Anaerolineaceae bacterium]